MADPLQSALRQGELPPAALAEISSARLDRTTAGAATRCTDQIERLAPEENHMAEGLLARAFPAAAGFGLQAWGIARSIATRVRWASSLSLRV